MVQSIIDSPEYKDKAYCAMLEMLKLPKALMGGTTEMRKQAQTFLPQEEAESDPSYKSRLNRSFLFGGFERTISILTGEVFNKPVALSEETPDPIKEYADNIDLQGNNLTRFSKLVFAPALYNGIGFILVDTPPLPKDEEGNTIPATKATDKAMGRRLYWIHIPADALLGGQVRIDNGNWVYEQIRIKETLQEPDGLFGNKEVEQIRVLYPGRWETWRQLEATGQFELYDSGESPLPYIPLVPFVTGVKESNFTAKPPLTGLAELNQSHWISSSDQNNILHFTRIPFLFGKGLAKNDKGEIIISPRNLFHSDNPESDLKFVEHSGAAMGDGWKDLERLEMLMSLWGLELISDNRSGNVTATEKALTGAKTGSFLNSVALDYQDAVNQAIQFSCDILNIEMKGGAKVNTDFSLAISNFDSSTLLNGFKIGLIDRTTTIDEFKRRGIISEDADPVDIAAAITNDSRIDQMGSLGGGLM